MPKVCGVDKVVGQSLKPKTQGRREGISMPIPVTPKSVFQPHRVYHHYFLEMDRQVRAGAMRKTIGPKLQPTPQPQTSPLPHLCTW